MSSLGTFKWCNFFSPKYFKVNNLDVSYLDPDGDQPEKYQLVHRDDSRLCPKSVRWCEHCQIAFSATVGVREITDNTDSKKKFSGNILLQYLTKYLRKYDLNFNFKMVSVPKRAQGKSPEGGLEQIRKRGMILDSNAS